MANRIRHDKKAGHEIDSNDQGPDERDPNGLSGKDKGDSADSCARTYPVASDASAPRFLSMECFAQPHSTVTELFWGVLFLINSVNSSKFNQGFFL